MICTDHKTSSPCNGDSGGPLSCETGGTYKVVGVVSANGASCNASAFPNIFTKVSAYRTWIDEYMQNETLSQQKEENETAASE